MRDNYFGYHNNCIESRFYFDDKDEKNMRFILIGKVAMVVLK